MNHQVVRRCGLCRQQGHDRRRCLQNPLYVAQLQLRNLLPALPIPHPQRAVAIQNPLPLQQPEPTYINFIGEDILLIPDINKEYTYTSTKSTFKETGFTYLMKIVLLLCYSNDTYMNELLLDLLKNNVKDCNTQNIRGMTALYLVSINLNNTNIEIIYKTATILLENGADPMISTCLHSICSRCDCYITYVRLVELFIKYGSDINAKNSKNCIPFDVLCENSNNYQIIQLFLDKGCNPNRHFNDEPNRPTPFILYSKKGNSPEVFRLLLEYKGDVSMIKEINPIFMPIITEYHQNITSKKIYYKFVFSLINEVNVNHFKLADGKFGPTILKYKMEKFSFDKWDTKIIDYLDASYDNYINKLEEYTKAFY